MVPTGLILDIPAGHSVRIHPRSGNAIKKGLSFINCEGVVDSDYTDPLMIPVINLSDIQTIVIPSKSGYFHHRSGDTFLFLNFFTI